MAAKPRRTAPAQIDDEIARRAVAICEEAQAENILLYDVRKTSVLADFYLVCSGGSDPHLRAIRNRLEKGLKELGAPARHVSGTPSSHWLVLDFGNVLVHVFDQGLRDYYRIEELWEPNQLVFRSDA